MKPLCPEPSARRASAAGFTLLEVLLAMVLMATLLAALWGLLGMYTHSVESSSRRTDEAQLVRAWLQQLRHDIAQALSAGGDEMPNMPPPHTAAQPGRFLGGPSSLTFDLYRAAGNAAGKGVADMSGEPPSRPDQPQAAARELRQVSYALAEVHRSRGDRRSGSASLVVRREMAWLDAQQPDPAARQTRRSRDPFAILELVLDEEPGISPGMRRLVEHDLFTDTGDDVAAPTARRHSQAADSAKLRSNRMDHATARDGTTSLVPEIEHVHFRYFDGASWTSAWDSRQRHSFPRAIEVSFRIREPSHMRPMPKPGRDRQPFSATDRFDELAQSQRERQEQLESQRGDAPLPGSHRALPTSILRPGERRALIAVTTGFNQPVANRPHATPMPPFGAALPGTRP